ncbi:MAG: hypothetical protein K2M41_07535 [Muribaculaceae bacterium]|nr:hypothetical protein [Muribaculaceae bacterium]
MKILLYIPDIRKLHRCIIGMISAVVTALIFALNTSAMGNLQIRSFTPEIYNGASQNWAIAQDSIGRIYVGNPHGVLTFDGIRWNRIFPANYSTVRSLLYDNSSKRLYAGCSEDFGYFSPEESTGELTYTSLLSSLGNEKPQFSEVWNILKGDSTVWFQTDNHIIEYRGEKSRSIKFDHRITTSNYLAGRLYIALEDQSILTYSNGRIIPLKGADILRGVNICAILPFANNKLLIATREKGLYLYSDSNIEPLNTDFSSYLEKNLLFCASVQGDYFAFGTISGGAIVKNFRTGETHYVNKNSGLQDNTILKAEFDYNNNLWLCLDNGLDYVLLNSPLRNLAGATDAIGAGYAALLNGSNILLGTNQGLFSTPFPPQRGPEQKQMNREVAGQIWSLIQIGNDIMIAADAGLWVKNNGIYKVADIPGTHKVAKLKSPDKAIAACYDGFHLIRKVGNRWEDGGIITGNKGITGAFSIDNKNNIWVNHWLKGIYRLHYDHNTNTFSSVSLYSTANGLPDNSGNSVDILNGAPAISTRSAFYTWDPSTDSIVKFTLLDTNLEKSQGEAIKIFNDSLLLLLASRSLRITDIDAFGKMRYRSVPLFSPTGHIIPGFEEMMPIASNRIIIGNNKGFWICDTDKETNLPPFPAVYVNNVIANTDSLIYRANMTGKINGIRIPYSLNSLRFELGTNILSILPSSLKCSTKLENYEEEWGPYNSIFSREYTKLHEGKYRLMIRLSTGADNEIIETSFDFEVLPPWYRTIWAKIVYFILLCGAAYFIYTIAIQWKRRAESRVEQRKEEELEKIRKDAHAEALRKDYEIATLKSEQLEIDVKHKSGELSAATMNLIRKNEILNLLADRIKIISQSPDMTPEIRKDLARLITAINENISNDDVWDDFKTNFDIVYNNFTTRLHNEFPTLTVGDLRLCCYIKMGLSSKEVAPLINISIKSVEMARYRVRRKLGLTAGDASLTEYIANY